MSVDDALIAAVLASAARPVLLIDGRSGSGKTELARRLAPAIGAQLVSLDEVYPGWGGLEAGGAAVQRDILDPVAPGWRRWDWARGREAEWHPLDPELPLVVEGCGSLSRANRALASFGIWLELDETERHRRAVDRDGAAFEPYWQLWAAQEALFVARERPESLADIVLDLRRGARSS